MSFEEDMSSPIFKLKYAKSNRLAFQQKDETPIDEKDLLQDLPSATSSENRDTLWPILPVSLFENKTNKIDCAKCCENMMLADWKKRYLSFILPKGNGGLIYSSDDIVKIVRVREKYFKFASCDADGKINPFKNLLQKFFYSLRGKFIHSSMEELFCWTHTRILIKTVFIRCAHFSSSFEFFYFDLYIDDVSNLSIHLFMSCNKKVMFLVVSLQDNRN